MCADCAYAMPEEKAVSTSEFGGSEPLGIDYYKAKLEEARDRIKQLDKPITGETSDGYHTFNELYSAACLCDCPACRIRKRTSNS